MAAEDEIPKHYQSLFTQNVEHTAQKEGSLLYSLVSHGSYTGESAEVVKQFGPTKARRGDNSRYGDTPIMSTPRDQRWVFPEVVDWGDLFDRNDLMKQLGDPTSPLTKGGAMSIGREWDNIIIESLDGVAKTGKNGSTNTVFNAAMEVGVQVGINPAADTGANYGKIVRARRLLREKYAIHPMDRLIYVAASQQEEDLFNDEKMINRRYRRTETIEDGELGEPFRVTFVFLEELPKVGNNRSNFLFAQSGVHFGTWEGLNTRIAPNPNKKFNQQLYQWSRVGATRTQETKVVRIICKEV